MYLKLEKKQNMSILFKSIKQQLLTSLNDLFCTNQSLNLDEYKQKKIKGIGLILLNTLIITLITYHIFKFYFYFTQHPICKQRNYQLQVLNHFFISTTILFILISAGIVALAYFDFYIQLYYIGYLPQARYKRTYIIKLFLSIIAFLFLISIINYFFQGNVFYQTGQYSSCNKIVITGKKLPELNVYHGELIDTSVLRQIQNSIMKQLQKQKSDRSITFFEGNSGIGKSIAIKAAVKKLLNQNRTKQILVYYTNYQQIQEYKPFFQFNQSYYNIDIAKATIRMILGYINDQAQDFNKANKQINQQFEYLGSRAKIVIIFDGVNQVKKSQKFLQYLKLFAKLTKTHLDIHLFISSSQSGLQAYYDSKYSFLREKHTKTNLITNLNESELGNLFNKMIEKSNISNEQKNKIMQQKNKIIELCYGFKELKTILTLIQQKIHVQKVDKILKELKKNTYKNQLKKIIPQEKKKLPFTIDNVLMSISQNDRLAICLILESNPQKILQNIYNVQELQSKNILFSHDKFYSKVIEESFRENFKCGSIEVYQNINHNSLIFVQKSNRISEKDNSNPVIEEL